jgi:hypothetical protein
LISSTSFRDGPKGRGLRPSLNNREEINHVRYEPIIAKAMVYFTGSEWDDFGRLVMAVGFIAMLAYLAPGMMSLSPLWARRMQIAAIAFLCVALVLAGIGTVAWFL